MTDVKRCEMSKQPYGNCTGQTNKNAKRIRQKLLTGSRHILEMCSYWWQTLYQTSQNQGNRDIKIFFLTISIVQIEILFIKLD